MQSTINTGIIIKQQSVGVCVPVCKQNAILINYHAGNINIALVLQEQNPSPLSTISKYISINFYIYNYRTPYRILLYTYT